MTVPQPAIEALGWVATATFIASYFFARPEALVRVQIVGGVMWIAYGALVHATPVVAANLLVVAAAGWKIWRPPVFEAEDFGKEFTPELRAQEERLRAEVERQRKS
jgi:hypothetical protein